MVTLVVGTLRAALVQTTALAAENALLRQQLIVAKRHLHRRPRFRWTDRLSRYQSMCAR